MYIFCSRHLHHKSRKYSLQEGARGGGADGERQVPAASTDEPLPEADLDELRSHRIDDQRVLRRLKLQPRVAKNNVLIYLSNVEITSTVIVN